MSDSSVLVNQPNPATADAEIDAEQLDDLGPQQGLPLRRERVQIGGDELAKVAPVSATLGLSTNPAKIDATNDEIRIAGNDEATSSTTRTFIADSDGRQIIRPWGADTWAQGHAPAGNTIATTTKAAGGSGVRHICTGFTVSVTAAGSAPTATTVLALLRDGASGAGTVLWAAVIGIEATAGRGSVVSRSGVWRGTANTAMCLEFAAAGGANTIECVAIEGVSVTEA